MYKYANICLNAGDIMGMQYMFGDAIYVVESPQEPM